MSSTTVAEFANELKKSTDTLLEQLKSAGVPKSSVSDVLTDSDKHSLLGYLQNSHGTASLERKKITLVKKQTTEIKQADSTGKARTIQVEVRKKRTFVRRDDGTDVVVEHGETEVIAAEWSAPTIDNAELARREEEARHQADFIRRQEEELAQRRKEREDQEAKERDAADKAAAAADAIAKKKAAEAPVSAAVVDEAKAVAAKAAEADSARLVEVERQRAVEASKAKAAEEAARAADLGERRRKAEAEAAAIRSMMATPKKVLVAHKPEPVKAPAADPKAIKGTLHKPAAGSTTAKPAAGTTAGVAGAGKEVKSAKLSSS